MAILLSNLTDDLTEEIHKIKCKDCDCFLEYKSVEGNLIKYNLSFNKDYSNKLDDKLKKKFKKTFQFSNNDINEFILLFRKVVYPYEYIDDWEKFNETTLPEKEEFYSKLNFGEITDVDYMHGKRVCKGFELKDLGEYHDLYFKSDLFRNLRIRFCKISFNSD